MVAPLPPARGVLPIQALRALTQAGTIFSTPPLQSSQYQPNSIDLRLGPKAYRTRCSFLPVKAPVRALLNDPDLVMYEIDLTKSHVFECGETYLIPLLEGLDLPPHLWGLTNPKSSTGRLDMLARIVTEDGHAFDTIPAGYRGHLYLDLVTRSFPIRMRSGDSLVQLRLLTGKSVVLSDEETMRLADEHELVRDSGGITIPAKSLAIDDGVLLSVRLLGKKDDETVGFVSRKNTRPVDFSRQDHPIRTYWSRIQAANRKSDRVLLHPEEFYIFSSCERVRIPPQICAEMVAFDVKSGEVRTHYAGFFDSGFGMEGNGAHVVLEVRNRDMPFLVQHGQRLFRLKYYWNTELPEITYGSALGSNYQGQGLRLAKHFGQTGTEPRPQLELWEDEDFR
jgi:dCTP deaminase